MTILVGLVAFKKAGKTTITKKMKEMFEPDINMIGFANPLYKMLEVLGVTYEEIQDRSLRDVPHRLLGGKTIQHALNSLGTSWGRKMIYENIWTDRALDAVIPGVINVADNVRFPNEFNAVRSRGGILIAITNPEVYDDGTEPEAHIAELQKQCDFFVDNRPGFNSLADAAHRLRTIIRWSGTPHSINKRSSK